MKLIKTIDERFAEIGFTKVSESKYYVSYERMTEHGYVQCLDIVRKESDLHLIQSYEKGVNADGFNNCVGLTMYEARLCCAKMRKMGMQERVSYGR